jgi:hypothetical protein
MVLKEGPPQACAANGILLRLAANGRFPPESKELRELRSWWFPDRAPEVKDSLVQVFFFPVQFCSGSEFLRAVAESKDETFVQSLVVRSVLKNRWDAYALGVLQAQFALHVLTFVSLAALGHSHIATQVLVSAMIVSLLVTEVCQLVALRASYFCSVTHLIDFAFACLLLYLAADPNDDNVRALTTCFFWLRCVFFLRVFEDMSALLLMVKEIIRDTRESMVLLAALTVATAHVFVSGGYLPANYLAVLFRAVGIGLLGDNLPEEFLPEEFPPDTTASGAVAIKITMFLMCTYVMNMVLMNFLIAVMGDTFERVTEQKEVLALKNKAQAIMEVDAYIPTCVSGRATPRNLLVCEAQPPGLRGEGRGRALVGLLGRNQTGGEEVGRQAAECAGAVGRQAADCAGTVAENAGADAGAAP